MRWMITLGLALAIGWAALPAQAKDDDAATMRELRERIQRLETQNGLLRDTLKLTQAQARKDAEIRELTAQLLASSEAMTKTLQERARLLAESSAADRQTASLRAQWLTLQLNNAEKELRARDLAAAEYYGALFRPLGAEAARVLAARLAADPKTHARRLAPIVGGLGADARGVLPILARLAADKTHQESGAAGYIAKAIAAIRTDVAARDAPK
ncbi:MAG: hypothetical protein P1V36_01560 [Planctomycetota bacterium]|nr:hypothetical protein [Planctomycetota bacterium]